MSALSFLAARDLVCLRLEFSFLWGRRKSLAGNCGFRSLRVATYPLTTVCHEGGQGQTSPHSGMRRTTAGPSVSSQAAPAVGGSAHPRPAATAHRRPDPCDRKYNGASAGLAIVAAGQRGGEGLVAPSAVPTHPPQAQMPPSSQTLYPCTHPPPRPV